MKRQKNRVLPLLAMFAAVSMALTACNSGDGTDPAAPDGQSEETPAGGGDAGTLTLGVNMEPTDFSPSRVQTILFPFTRQIYESLINYDDDLNTSPALATE